MMLWMFPKRKAGMTLTEAMLSLTLIGIISVMTLPSILYGGQTSTALFKTKNMANELVKALGEYRKKNPGNVGFSNSEIAEQLSYVRKDETTGVCGPFTPCYYFADGGDFWTAKSPPANGIAFFNYDPDGTGSLPRVSLRLDVNTGRIAPCNAFFNNSPIPAPCGGWVDPPYVSEWTKQ